MKKKKVEKSSVTIFSHKSQRIDYTHSQSTRQQSYKTLSPYSCKALSSKVNREKEREKKKKFNRQLKVEHQSSQPLQDSAPAAFLFAHRFITKSCRINTPRNTCNCTGEKEHQKGCAKIQIPRRYIEIEKRTKVAIGYIPHCTILHTHIISGCDAEKRSTSYS